MSLARTALRLAAKAALVADPVVSAMCGNRIYDSRIGQLDTSDIVPVIVIFTEGESGKAFSSNNGGPPFDASCELNLEISMRALVAAEDGDMPDIRFPETDQELEASLDLIEAAAIDAVTVAETTQGALVRQVTRRVTTMSSVRYTSADTGDKLAVRLVTLTAELKGFDPDDPLDVPTGPFAVLPEPLRSVCSAMEAGSSGLATCQAIAAKIPAAATPERFTGADVTYSIETLDPSTPPPTPGDPSVDHTFQQNISTEPDTDG